MVEEVILIQFIKFDTSRTLLVVNQDDTGCGLHGRADSGVLEHQRQARSRQTHFGPDGQGAGRGSADTAWTDCEQGHRPGDGRECVADVKLHKKCNAAALESGTVMF